MAKKRKKKSRINARNTRLEKSLRALAADLVNVAQPDDQFEMYKCGDCGKLFLDRTTCAYHMQTHGTDIKGVAKFKLKKVRKYGPKYAKSSLKVNGRAVQGGAPGLGKKA